MDRRERQDALDFLIVGTWPSWPRGARPAATGDCYPPRARRGREPHAADRGAGPSPAPVAPYTLRPQSAAMTSTAALPGDEHPDPLRPRRLPPPRAFDDARVARDRRPRRVRVV